MKKRNFIVTALMAAAAFLAAGPAMAQDEGVTTSLSAEDRALYAEGINPADLEVEDGKAFFETARGGKGKSCASCHGGSSPQKSLDGAAATFPKWSDRAGRVVSLEDQINMCLKGAMDAEPLKYKSGAMNGISLYVRSLSLGQKVNVETGGKAKATWELGKKVYSTRRGQRNFSCSVCHEDLAGSTIRMQPLAQIGGAAAHWPAYRMTKGKTFLIQGRFQGCMKNARMKHFPIGDYRMVALELYVTSLANGYPIETPGWVR